MLGWNEAAWLAFFWSLALKGTAVLCAAYLAAFALRHRSAAARHLVWTAAFAALLALPLLSVSLPSLRIPGASSILPDASNLVFRATATATAADALQQEQLPHRRGPARANRAATLLRRKPRSKTTGRCG